MIFKDKVGNELKPGDLVVYGQTWGRCAGLAYGLVLDITTAKDSWNDRIKAKLKVIGTDSWGDGLNSRASFLEFPERILRINHTQVPDKTLTLLREYKK